MKGAGIGISYSGGGGARAPVESGYRQLRAAR